MMVNTKALGMNLMVLTCHLLVCGKIVTLISLRLDITLSKKPLPGGQLLERPADGESSGEIILRSPWLTQGHLKYNHNSEHLWRGGYLHAGDVANVDATGYFKITDRAKDVIKIAKTSVGKINKKLLRQTHL